MRKMIILLFHYRELNIPAAVWYKNRYCHWLGLCLTSGTLQKRLFQCDKTFCIHLGRLSFSVVTGHKENSGVGRDLCWQLSLTAGWELPLLCCPCAPSASRSWEQRAWGTLGTLPTGLAGTQAGTQELLSLTCTVPRTGGSCAWSPAPGTVTLHSQALNSDTRLKINSFGSYSYQRNWGEGGGKANKQENSVWYILYACYISHFSLFI